MSNNNQLTHSTHKHKHQKFPIYLILDNVKDSINIESIFRISDALGGKEIFICGDFIGKRLTNKKLIKVSQNTINYVDYEICPNVLDFIEKLKKLNINLLVLELTVQSIPLQNYKLEKDKSYAFVIENERFGIYQEVLDCITDTVHIDMYGTNSTTNLIEEEFKYYLKNKIPWYIYINEAKYVLMYLNKNNEIQYNVATTDYSDLISFPRSEKEYNTPEEVLSCEMNDCNATIGVIFENTDNKGNFKIIAKKGF